MCIETAQIFVAQVPYHARARTRDFGEEAGELEGASFAKGSQKHPEPGSLGSVPSALGRAPKGSLDKVNQEILGLSKRSYAT